MDLEMLQEIINRVHSKLEELKSQSRADDPVVKFLVKDLVSDFQFKSGLRILPCEVVEQYGLKVLQDEKEYQKHYDPKHDVFLQEWEKHYEGYWMDRLHLIEDYLNPSENNYSPFEVYNRLSDQMIKIEKRSLLLIPVPKTVEQKQTRLDGSEKDYLFIRSYWIDEKGEKKRMIARHIGNRYLQMEKEIADLFHVRGYAVHRQYRSEKGHMYDMMIERDGMKTVVEINMVKERTFESAFNNLFLFDELQKRFIQDYATK